MAGSVEDDPLLVWRALGGPVRRAALQAIDGLEGLAGLCADRDRFADEALGERVRSALTELTDLGRMGGIGAVIAVGRLARVAELAAGLAGETRGSDPWWRRQRRIDELGRLAREAVGRVERFAVSDPAWAGHLVARRVADRTTVARLLDVPADVVERLRGGPVEPPLGGEQRATVAALMVAALSRAMPTDKIASVVLESVPELGGRSPLGCLAAGQRERRAAWWWAESGGRRGPGRRAARQRGAGGAALGRGTVAA